MPDCEIMSILNKAEGIPTPLLGIDTERTNE